MNKPILVLVFGTTESVNIFEKNWLIKSKPLINQNALIIHYPNHGASLASMLELMLEEQSTSNKEYIFLLNGDEKAERFKETSEYISRYYSHQFREIKFIFTHNEKTDNWSEDDVKIINGIAEDNNFSLSFGDIFEQSMLNDSSSGNNTIFNHIQASTKILFDIIDVSKFLYEENTTIDYELQEMIKTNIMQLVDLNQKYIRTIDKYTDKKEDNND